MRYPIRGALFCVFLITAVHAETIVVRPGDTLFGIARRELGDAGRWGEIARVNTLRAPYILRAGDSLVLPGSPASVEPMVEAVAETPEPVESDIIDSARTMIRSDYRPEFVPAHVVALDELVEILKKRNPSIRAAEEAAAAASYRPSQARSLPDPILRAALRFDPQREVMVENGVTTVTEKTMTMPMFQLSQMIPLGKRGPMGDYESAMARTSLEMVGMERVSRLNRLKAAYAELFFLDRAASTHLRIREIVNLLVGSTEAMYRVGEARQSDLLRAHLEVSMISDQLLMIEGRRRSTAAAINGLLDRPEGEVVGTPMSLATYALDEARAAKLIEASPAVRVAAAEADAARAKIAVARSMLIPDVEVMGGTMINRDLDPRIEVGVGISLPIWSRTKQKAGIKEAEAKLREAEEREKAARADIREKIESALAMAKAAHLQAELYRTTILPQARLTLDASLSNYRVGEVDFMTVMENTTTLLGYEIAKDRSVAEFYRAIAMLEEATGSQMEWKVI